MQIYRFAVRAAASNLEYFAEFARNLSDDEAAASPDSPWADAFDDRFVEAINNDLNTPQALAAALELVAEAYRRGDRRIWNRRARTRKADFRRILPRSSASATPRARPKISHAPTSCARSWRRRATRSRTIAAAPRLCRAGALLEYRGRALLESAARPQCVSHKGKPQG